MFGNIKYSHPNGLGVCVNYKYRCFECGAIFEMTPELMVCPTCSAQQKADDPLHGVLEVCSARNVKKDFDIFEFLPVEKEFFPAIPVGNTPLWEVPKLRQHLQMKNLFIKDESTQPTGSFKDRASYLVAAFANKHGIKEITLASTGNAGSSMCGVAAATDLKVTLFLPKTAPQAKMCQALQYGARLILVDGNYDKAYDLSMEFSKKTGSMSRNTAYNPLTIEGKKTVSLEIFKQLGNKAPDFVFVPVGDGVIISGVYKGFRDLKEKGLINKIPVIYSVQSSQSDAINRAFVKGYFENIPTNTLADSICVDVPRNGHLALKNLKDHAGRIVTISDEEILSAQHELSRMSGLFTEPAGATAFAGFQKAYRQNEFDRDACVVVLTTGSGLKDAATALKGVKAPQTPIKTLNELV